MFQNDSLKTHLETSSSVSVASKVIAEWNMNVPTNIYQVGNYRYRPAEGPGSKYGLPAMSFDPQDVGYYYTDATYSDILIDGGLDNQDIPTTFLKRNEKEGQLYSLEDCFGKNRPRSGINKLRWFPNKYSHFVNNKMAERPRYYPSSRDDVFKYWTSYRKDETNTERGIANTKSGDYYYIDDASPYVVYNEPVPANRIVVKMQTNIGDAAITYGNQQISDPFYGQENSTTPVRWKIQYLDDNTWVDAVRFDESSVRADGSPIIPSDGYVELCYGLIVPEIYSSSFKLLGSYVNETLLPDVSTVPYGHSYLVQPNQNSIAKIYISTGSSWAQVLAQYGWQLNEQSDYQAMPYVTELVETKTAYNPNTGQSENSEFALIRGLRIVAETMNKYESTLDLIELSPRLAVDLSDKTTQFKITKSASDLGVSGLPVSQLLASNGTLELFDYDQAFLSTNKKSIVANYINQKVQFKFYEVIKNVNGVDVSVPIKTLYSESFPETKSADRSVSISMRDLFYYFEQQTAPQLLAQGVSFSYAISMLLDSIGFSNYTILSTDSDSELEIPFFFIPSDTSVAEVLNDLALSAQSAMFFDEYNNLVVMTRNYMMPSETDRETDITLYGSQDFTTDGVIQNSRTSTRLANIESIASQDKEIYNQGSINYTSRYIQRSYGSIKQASLLDREKTWSYKPVLLWEVSPTEQTKPINSEIAAQSSYVLGAIPLNSDLSDEVPRVKNREIINNVIDFGDGIYWVTRYNGYLYANGEIIKYDAVEFSIPGLSSTSSTQSNDLVWITSAEEYARYFALLPFNGKMYPTGRVRIFAEADYEELDGVTFLKNGPVAKHGRAQFGTSLVYHNAGLSNYWSDNANVRGCKMDFLYLSDLDVELPPLAVGPAGLNHARAQGSSRTGIIKNFLSSQTIKESDKSSDYPATVQSSALVFNGSSFASTENPLTHISYVYKELNDRFTHVGTRMRIIGKIEDSPVRGQSPVGAFTYYTPSETSSDQPPAVAGASGGIGISVNPETNVGYYFEIAALTDDNLTQYSSVQNVLFYKIMQNADDEAGDAIPVALFSGIADILVDDGRFVGQSRLSSTETTTVYDLAVEYVNIGSTRRFFLYINGVNIAIVDDTDPLPVYNNLALFVRGSTESMFENVYALSSNYSQNSVYSLTNSSSPPIAQAFGVDDLTSNSSFQKYTVSGLIQSSYLSGVGPSEPPKYNIYYEEFGTIMREAAYFNIRYDKAYPALYAKLSPTFNKVKGYTVSNFFAGAYGAEFMVFNTTDTALNLDSTSGNYLRIQGVTFTQSSTNELTVDDYFDNKSNASLISFNADNSLTSPTKTKKNYFNIKQSRIENGIKSFSLSPSYVQSEDSAQELMGWMVDKIMKPSKSVGLSLFAMPILQLGDIVTIDYKNSDGVNEIADPDTRFVVYHIEYSRSDDGPSMNVYLSEVT